MAPLRIGVLGAARIAREFAAGVAESEKVVVAAVASRDLPRAEAFARDCGVARVHATYDALLADPDIDAIYNPLPNSLHGPLSIRAARAGKHVLCEKPLSTSEAEVAEMFAAAESAGVKLVEAYPYLSQPQTIGLRKLVAEGEIGAPRLIQAGFGFNLDKPDDIRFDPALGGGALFDLGCYTVSLIRVLTGAPPARVTAQAQWTASGVDLSLAATLEYADGLLAQINCSFASTDFRTATIVGATGVVETNFWNHTNEHRPALLRIKRGIGWKPTFETLTLENANGFRGEAESFADYVRGEGPWTGATKTESLDIAATLETILRSAREGRTLTVRGG